MNIEIANFSNLV